MKMSVTNSLWLPQVASGNKLVDSMIMVLVSVAVLLSSTCLVTMCQFHLGFPNGFGSKKYPKTIPYWIPFLGSSISMARNAHDLYETAMKQSGGRNIIGARLGPMYVYFIGGAKNVQTIFRSSRSLTSDFLILQVYKNVIGVPTKDVNKFETDKSGHHVTPLSNIQDSERIWRHTHEAQSRTLQSGDQVEVLGQVFTREMLRIANDEPLGEWTTVPLHHTFKNKMSTASTISLIGRGAFRYNPKLIEDFWVFMDGFMGLFLGYPRFLAPKAWDARDRLTKACTKVLESVEEEYDSLQSSDPDWDENIGSRVNRLRDKASRDCGISISGRGSLLAGFLIGINGNAVPLSCWIMIEIIRDPELLSALRQEIETAISADKAKEGEIDFDIRALLSLPLLSSVFTETLRFRMSTTPTRELLTDLEVNGYTLKAGNVVMLPSWLAHSNDQWSSPGHPATTFWAQRFLQENSSNGQEKSESSTISKPGTLFPFGGGSSICPGRFFAKQEILTAIAIMVLKFDFEFVKYIKHDGSDSDRRPEPDIKNAGSGALMPDRDMLVRWRRRM